MSDKRSQGTSGCEHLPPLQPGEESVYDTLVINDTEETLWLHCVKAIRHGLRFGEHGLPLLGAGDWNDGMNRGVSKAKVKASGWASSCTTFCSGLLHWRIASWMKVSPRCVVHRLCACKAISKPTPGMVNGTGAGILTMVLPLVRKPYRTAGLMRLHKAGCIVRGRECGVVCKGHAGAG